MFRINHEVNGILIAIWKHVNEFFSASLFKANIDSTNKCLFCFFWFWAPLFNNTLAEAISEATSTQFKQNTKKCRKYFLCGEIIFMWVYLQIAEISRCFAKYHSESVYLFLLPLVRLSLKTFSYFFNLAFFSVSFHKQFNFTWFCFLMFVLKVWMLS